MTPYKTLSLGNVEYVHQLHAQFDILCDIYPYSMGELLSHYRRHVSSAIYMRSVPYQARVVITERIKGSITAKIRGSSTYTVCVKDGQMSSCTCPYSGVCKHVLALVFVVDADPALSALISQKMSTGTTVVDEDEYEEDGFDLYDLEDPGYIRAPRSRNISSVNTSSRSERLQRHFAHARPQTAIQNTYTPPPPPTLLDRIHKLTSKTKKIAVQQQSQTVCYQVIIYNKSYWSSEPEMRLAATVCKADTAPDGTVTHLHPIQSPRRILGAHPGYVKRADMYLLGLICAGNEYGHEHVPMHSEAVPLRTHLTYELLLEISQTGRATLEMPAPDPSPTRGYKKSPPLIVPLLLAPVALEHRLRLQILKNKISIVSDYTLDGAPFVQAVLVRLQYDPALLICDDHQIYKVTYAHDSNIIEELTHYPPSDISQLDDPAQLMSLLMFCEDQGIIVPDTLLCRAIRETPQPVAVLRPKHPDDPYRLNFRYGTQDITIDRSTRYVTTDEGEVMIRDMTIERTLMVQYTDIIASCTEHLSPTDTFPFGSILTALPSDWIVFIDKTPVSRSTVQLSLASTSGIDWLDITGTAQIGDVKHDLLSIMSGIETTDGMVKIRDTYHYVDSTTRQRLDTLKQHLRGSEGIRLHRTQLGALESLDFAVDESTLHQEWVRALKAIRNFKGVQKTKAPSTIQATLRPYQEHGVSYLSYLHNLGFGGILADEMGLGKTLQALSIIDLRRDPARLTLIVAPTSVVSNWESECARYAPHLRVTSYTGARRALPNPGDCDIVLTSYALLWRDHDILAKHTYDFLILDEAHYIKNSDSRTAVAARSLTAAHRISLTGTPLENRLSDLYSQFAFLNPGQFGTAAQFEESYARPIERGQDTDRMKQLRQIINPFILRRTKDMVLKDLPQKIEQTTKLQMGSAQRKLYDHVRHHFASRLKSLISSQGIAKSQIQILEALLRLRQVCCDPHLVADLPYVTKSLTTKESAKREALILQLTELIRSGHKVLVFSQFTSMLDLISEACVGEKIPTITLTGKSKNRSALIKSFQDSPVPQVFLISLKAGGVGLNLTSADYVIHYDPWWNPAVEDQASARAHRIGQAKTVNVYKYIISDSIEEKILQLQEQKRGMIKDILSSRTVSKRLTAEDLEFLLG